MRQRTSRRTFGFALATSWTLAMGLAPMQEVCARRQKQLLQEAQSDFRKKIDADVFESERALFPYKRGKTWVKGYSSFLGKEFIERIYGLGPSDTWLEIGGKGVAPMSYGGQAKVVIVTPHANPTMFPPSLSRLYKNDPKRIRVLSGRRLEELGDDEVSPKVVSDVNAAATYWIDLGETVQKILGLLEVGGYGYIATRAPYAKILDRSGNPIHLTDWLSMGQGIEVDPILSLRRKDLLPPPEKTARLRGYLGEEPTHVRLVFQKKQDKATVPPLELRKWEPTEVGLPSGRTFQIE